MKGDESGEREDLRMQVSEYLCIYVCIYIFLSMYISL